MKKIYDKTYRETEHVFGIEPEDSLVKFIEKINKNYPVLDIGAGQGRNSVFMADQGFTVDAIDTSKVAVETIAKISDERNLKINVAKSDFLKFNSGGRKYSCIMIFGLFQMMNWHDINEFVKKAKKLTVEGGLIFITAFGTKDPSYKECVKNYIEIGKNSFFGDETHIKTFLEEDEILSYFSNETIIHHFEGLGKEHKHGNGQLEQHYLVELVVKVGNL